MAQASGGKIKAVRNFYGVLTVDHRDATNPSNEAYALVHGEILHGLQFVSRERSRLPTAYYSGESGVGLVLSDRSPLRQPGLGFTKQNLRIGIVGLGIGTIAAYGRPGDVMRFYEINPAVVQFASDNRYFHYLRDCPAHVEMVLGDARVYMEREVDNNTPQHFDVLVVDAFSGDAIPIHLITREAFQLYLRELNDRSSILAVHITNTLLDLRPVAIATADSLGLSSIWVHADGDGVVSSANDWILVSQDRSILDLVGSYAKYSSRLRPRQNRIWTDEYSNLFQVLKY